ncbi:hypothetical protein C3L33_11692, partial [Rhododendron williamsianum]
MGFSSTWPRMVLLVVFTGLMGSLEAYEFKVGGNQGWVLNPSENYNQWSARMRFQVNDTILGTKITVIRVRSYPSSFWPLGI